MLALVVFGVLGFTRLGVDQFPNMEFPVVTVVGHARRRDARGHGGGRHRRPRGAPQHDRRRARAPLDVADQGVAQIIVEFELGTNLDVAAQDVRDKVALARVAAADGARAAGRRHLRTPNDTPILWIPFRLASARAVETSEVRAPPGEAVPRDDPGRRAASRSSAASTATSASGSTATQLRARGSRPRPTCCTRCSASTSSCRAARSRATRVDYSVKTDAEFRSIEELEGMVVAQRRTARRCCCATSRASRTAPRTSRTAGALQRRADRRHRHPQADRRQHRRDRRRGATAARRQLRSVLPDGHDARRRVRLHRLLEGRPRGGRRDRVRAGLRRAARGVHRLRVPAPHAADLHRRARDPGVADRDLRRWSASPASRSTR